MLLELEKKIDEIGEENVAAFIAEPIQGAGGVIIPPNHIGPKYKEFVMKEISYLFPMK